MEQRKTLPEFRTYEEAGEWLDTHSTGDLEATDVPSEVASPLTIQILDVPGESEEILVVDRELSRRIRGIATQEGSSLQALVHKWLVEKVEEIMKSR